MGTTRSIHSSILCAAATLVLVIVPVLVGAAAARGAVAPADEIPLGNGQRLIVGQIGDVSIQSIKAAPALNGAGQLAAVASVAAVGGNAIQPVDVVTLRERGRQPLLLMQSGFPVPGFPKRTLERIDTVLLSDDGSVLIEAILKSDTGKARPPGRHGGSLWHWRQGKLYLLMAADEPLAGAAAGVVPQGWSAVVADGGVVTALFEHGTPVRHSGRYSLAVFKDGKLVLSELESRQEKGRAGLRYVEAHSAGPHTVVLREVLTPKGLPKWDMCRVVDGKLEAFAHYGDTAPAGIRSARGSPKLLGPVEQVRVTPGGRVLAALKVGDPGKASVQHAILLSEPNFGSWKKVAESDDAAPDGRTFHNLTYENGHMAACDDGHVVFTDQDKSAYFYLATPSGKLEKIADEATLPGLSDKQIRRVWTLGVADGGYALLEVLDWKAGPCAYAYDTKRGLRPLFNVERSLPRFAGGKARLVKVNRADEVPNALTSACTWSFVWEGPRGSSQGGIGLVNLSK